MLLHLTTVWCVAFLDSIHNATFQDDCWISIDGIVYDVTSFLQQHPGGVKVMMEYAGRDASKAFHALHSNDILQRFGNDLQIGVLSDASVEEPAVPSGTDDYNGASSVENAGKDTLTWPPRGGFKHDAKPSATIDYLRAHPHNPPPDIADAPWTTKQASTARCAADAVLDACWSAAGFSKRYQ